MREIDLAEWRKHPVTKEVISHARDQADQYNATILRMLSDGEREYARAAFYAGVIHGLGLAMDPPVKETENGE